MTLALIIAMLLDAAMGEPRWLWDRFPHPAVLMGRAIDWLDRRFNTGNHRWRNGLLVVIIMNAAAVTFGLVLTALPGYFAEIIVTAIFLAQRSLANHVGVVGDALRLSLPEGRRAVRDIVSRDTAAMDGSAVARSAIESAAENLSDGVIAPAFWFLVAGLPGLLVYKITNTADSMIGYLTPHHRDFGWAAARFDDLLNLIPARLTALLIKITAPWSSDWSEIASDARLHKSPNAGWPEAAMARALGIALAGPRSYDGTLREFPFVNTSGRKHLSPHDIDATVARLWRVWRYALILLCLVYVGGRIVD